MKTLSVYDASRYGSFGDAEENSSVITVELPDTLMNSDITKILGAISQASYAEIDLDWTLEESKSPFTVLYSLVGEDANILTSHVEAPNTREAFISAARGHHEDLHDAYTTKERIDQGLGFEIENYKLIAVYAGHLAQA